MGRDPSSPTFAYDKEATFVLQCQADSGYFSILALGMKMLFFVSLPAPSHITYHD